MQLSASCGKVGYAEYSEGRRLAERFRVTVGEFASGAWLRPQALAHRPLIPAPFSDARLPMSLEWWLPPA